MKPFQFVLIWWHLVMMPSYWYLLIDFINHKLMGRLSIPCIVLYDWYGIEYWQEVGKTMTSVNDVPVLLFYGKTSDAKHMKKKIYCCIKLFTWWWATLGYKQHLQNKFYEFLKGKPTCIETIDAKIIGKFPCFEIFVLMVTAVVMK